MKIRKDLKELRDAEVRFISLVDRAASRIPIRVLKRNTGESDMKGLDLARVMKGSQRPVIGSVSVKTQKSDTVSAQILKSIADHGFDTTRVRKSEADVVTCLHGAPVGGEVTVVRLSDQVAVGVRDFPAIKGHFGTFVKENGYVPDLYPTMAHLYLETEKALKGETGAQDPGELLGSFSSYLNAMALLPEEAYRLNDDVITIIKADAEVAKEEDATKGEMCKVCGEKMSACKCSVKAEDAAKAEEAAKAEAVAKEEAAKAEAEKATKKEETPSLDSLTTLIQKMNETVTASLTEMGTKVEHVVKAQEATNKSLDGVVQKQEAIEKKIAAEVIAPVVKDDRPAGETPVRKFDNDPRQGSWDSAYLPGRRRAR